MENLNILEKRDINLLASDKCSNEKISDILKINQELVKEYVDTLSICPHGNLLKPEGCTECYRECVK